MAIFGLDCQINTFEHPKLASMCYSSSEMVAGMDGVSIEVLV